MPRMVLSLAQVMPRLLFVDRADAGTCSSAGTGVAVRRGHVTKVLSIIITPCSRGGSVRPEVTSPFTCCWLGRAGRQPEVSGGDCAVRLVPDTVYRIPHCPGPCLYTYITGMASLLRFVFIILSCALLHALEILPSNNKYDGIQGDGIVLDCKFTLAPEDTGTLDIEWILVAPDAQKADQMVIMFNGKIYPQDGPLQGRVDFVSPTPEDGDASIKITTLKESDAGTYQCKVKKLPGSNNMKVNLNVYIKPAKTRCFVEGLQEIGRDLNLKCQAKEGSSPLTYSWQKISGLEKLPPMATVDSTGGVLTMKNASQEYSGTYRCMSRNKVGTDECIVILNVVPPANTAGIIAGAIIGTLLFIIVLGILVYFCCRKQKEKKYEKEIQHEIREDVAPPKSRASTARSYIGSNIGSNHSSLGSLSPSNMDGYSKARYNPVPSEVMERPPSHTPNYVPPKYHGLTVV